MSKPKTFKLTQPDENLARFIFHSQMDPKKRALETQSMHNYNSPPGVLGSQASLSKHSPRSVAPNYKKAARSFLKSNHSIDSDNTIQNFMMKDSDGKIIKTKHMLEREHDRVEKVKKARESSV